MVDVPVYHRGKPIHSPLLDEVIGSQRMSSGLYVCKTCSTFFFNFEDCCKKSRCRHPKSYGVHTISILVRSLARYLSKLLSARMLQCSRNGYTCGNGITWYKTACECGQRTTNVIVRKSIRVAIMLWSIEGREQHTNLFIGCLVFV